MLVLSRKRGQIIRIGPDISIIVMRIESQGIQLGTIAPRSTQIDRFEVMQGGPSYPARTKGAIEHAAIASRSMRKEPQDAD